MKRAKQVAGSAVSWTVAAVILAAAVLAVPRLVAADQATEDKAFFVAKGRVTYRVYCINCHGPKGKGDGSLAEMLSTTPADLTYISTRNGGKFPANRVRDIIDGRSEVRGHGMKEMPIWGDVFQTSSLEPSASDETREERARRKIHELVLYLESIQEPQE